MKLYFKMRQIFLQMVALILFKECGKSLLQNVLGYLLQNAMFIKYAAGVYWKKYGNHKSVQTFLFSGRILPTIVST